MLPRMFPYLAAEAGLDFASLQVVPVGLQESIDPYIHNGDLWLLLLHLSSLSSEFSSFSFMSLKISSFLTPPQ